MDLPPSQPSIDDLETAIAGTGGLAFVALKAPETARVRDANGFRAAVPAQAAEQALQALQALRAEILSVYDAAAVARVRMPASATRQVYASPFVDFLEPAPEGVTTSTPATSAQAPSGPTAASGALSSAAASGELIPWNVAQVNAPNAWPRATGAGAKVMLIGTGILPHGDNPSVPVGNCGGLFGACAADHIDGTYQMGIMLARQNGVGVVGVSHGVSPSDTYVWRAIRSDGVTIDLNIYYAGLNEAINRGIKLLLATVTHTIFLQTEANLIAQAWNGGTIMVADVGSENVRADDRYPAKYAHVVGVSGVTNSGSFAQNVPGCTFAGSTWGPMVDVAAGFWAYTTIVFSDGSQGYRDTRDLAGHCGTYFAAADVAGVIAMLQQQNPTWTPPQIVNQLFTTSSNSASPNEQIGYGIPNADKAIPNPPPPPKPRFTVSIAGPTSISETAICTWVASVSNGTAPYTYEWYRDGTNLVSQTDSYTGGMNGMSVFTLRVYARDVGGSLTWDEIAVGNDGFGECLT